MNGLRISRMWRGAGSRKGGPALEFALITPAFFGIVLVSFEILYAIVARSVVNYALESASRAAVTGGTAPTDNAARLQAITEEFFAATSSMIRPARLTLVVSACESMEMLNTNPAACRTGDAGVAREVVRFSATYSHSFLTQGAVCSVLAMPTCPPVTMNAQIVRRNEPF